MADENKAVSEMFPGGPACIRHWETTQGVVGDVAVIKEKLSDLKDIRQTVRTIEKHIAAQNGSIPRIETTLLELTKRSMDRQSHCDHRFEGLEINSASLSTRVKIWTAIVGAGAGAGVAFVVQRIVSHVM